MIRHTSIRVRLTLWYGVVLSVILVVFGASVYLLMRHHLLALTDAGLAEELTELAEEIERISSASGLDLATCSPRDTNFKLRLLTVGFCSTEIDWGPRNCPSIAPCFPGWNRRVHSRGRLTRTHAAGQSTHFGARRSAGDPGGDVA